MREDVKIYILAGGLGTRLAHVVKDVPKPMAEIHGIPFLAWQIQWLKRHNLTDIVLLVGHKKEYIVDYFNDGKQFGVTIRYSCEEELLGTGGAVIKALQEFPSKYCVILNGDTFFNIDLAWFLQYVNSAKKNHSFYLALKYKTDTGRYGNVRLSEDYRIVRFIEKSPQLGEGYINGGIYIGSSDVLRAYPLQKISLEHDIFPELQKAEQLFGIPFGDQFIDIGLPEDYFLAQKMVKKWFNTPKQRALFLDRDGIVIDDTGYISHATDVKFLPECLELVTHANQKGVKVVIVTNQSGVARGYFREQEVEAIHQHIGEYYQKHGAHIDQFYYCPYHEEGITDRYRKKSLFRKPHPGMLLAAIEELNLNGIHAMMVGDKDSDVIKLPYIRTYLIKGRYPLKNTAYGMPEILERFHRTYPSLSSSAGTEPRSTIKSSRSSFHNSGIYSMYRYVP